MSHRRGNGDSDFSDSRRARIANRKALAPALFLVSIGMLFYTAIVSPGYFAQKGQWIWVLIFGALFALAIIAVIRVLASIY